jgi:hypothetical protein
MNCVKIKVHQTIKAIAKHLSETIVISKREYAGNEEQQYFGWIGELTVLEILEMHEEIIRKIMSKNNVWDGGFDFVMEGKKVDVKTMGRSVDVKGEYANNLMEHQMKHDCFMYLFCSFNKTDDYLTVCGWMPKNEIKTYAEFHKQGDSIDRGERNHTSFNAKANMLCVPMEDLLGWGCTDSIVDLMQMMKDYCRDKNGLKEKLERHAEAIRRETVQIELFK